jgi:hypothetical protein
MSLGPGFLPKRVLFQTVSFQSWLPTPPTELHLEGDFKKTKLKLTWLAASETCPALELQHFGYLVTKRKLEEEDNFEDWVNRASVRRAFLRARAAAATLPAWTASLTRGRGAKRMPCFLVRARKAGDGALLPLFASAPGSASCR